MLIAVRLGESVAQSQCYLLLGNSGRFMEPNDLMPPGGCLILAGLLITVGIMTGTLLTAAGQNSQRAQPLF